MSYLGALPESADDLVVATYAVKVGSFASKLSSKSPMFLVV